MLHSTWYLSHFFTLTNCAFVICLEFRRITTINLEPTFMAKLDQYTPKIMSMVTLKEGLKYEDSAHKKHAARGI